jgi:hypothetical protein
MMDILQRLRSIIELNGDTYTVEEALSMMRQSAAEIERLRAALQDISDGDGNGHVYSGYECAAIARKALTAAQGS